MLPEHDLLTIAEVANALRVDETTVRRWIKQGTMEGISLPHPGERSSYRVRRITIETLLNS
jgi:excisionase family DNA binding protein